jgi:glycosyltransferase involved in cell wall biosynthesis
LIEAVASLGHHVDVRVVGEPAAVAAPEPGVQVSSLCPTRFTVTRAVQRRVPWTASWCRSVHSTEALSKLGREARSYDVAVVSQAALARYARVLDGLVPWVFDAHNVESQLAAQVGSLGHAEGSRLTRSLDARLMCREEQWLFNRAGTVMAVSAEDADAIRSQAPAARVTVRPNGVDPHRFALQPHEAAAAARLVMTGHFGYRPNVDGARWFVEHVLPLLRERRDDVTLTLVGREPAPALRALHAPSDGVVVTGEVADVRPYLAEADVYVVPLHSGGGSRLKVLEALAAGLPLVSTRVGVSGLDLGSAPPLLIGDTAGAFSSAVDLLLNDTDQRRRFIDEGRRLVCDRYDWRAIGAQVEHDLRTVVDGETRR